MPNVVEIVLRTIDEGATSGIENLHERLGSEGGGGLMGAIGAVAPVAIAAGTALAGAFALGDTAKKVDELGASVLDMQKKIGGSAEDVSRLHFALQETGMDTDAATRGFDTMAKGIDTNSKTVSHGLDELGLSGKDAAGNIRPMNDILLDVAEKFKTMPDGPQKTAVAMELFGRSGAALIPFLDRGSAGIADLEKESDKLGMTLSGSTLDAVHQNTIAQREFDAALEGLQIQIGTLLLPVITKLMELAVNLAVAFNEHVMPAIKALEPVIGQAVEWFGKFVEELQKNPFEALKNAFVDITTKIAEFETQLGAKLLELGKQFVTWVAPQIPPMLDELGKLLTRFGDWITAQETQDMINAKLAEWGKDFIAWIGDALPPFLLELGKVLLAFGEWSVTTATPFILEKTGEFSWAFTSWVVTKAIPALLTELLKVDVAFGEWSVTTAMPAMSEAMVQLGAAIVQGIADGIGRAWGGLTAKLGELISGLPDAAKKLLGISSPSTVFAGEVGAPIPQGIAAGIAANQGQISTALQGALGSSVGPGVTTATAAGQQVGAAYAQAMMSEMASLPAGLGGTAAGKIGFGSQPWGGTAMSPGQLYGALGLGLGAGGGTYWDNAPTTFTGIGDIPTYNAGQGPGVSAGMGMSNGQFVQVPAGAITAGVLNTIAAVSAAALNGQLQSLTAGPAPLGV
jgi:hypothetical protein